jgi:hypothetical protein
MIATITSKTSSLTVAVFDASALPAWVPSKAAANKAQFTGHPSEILRGLSKGDDSTPIDVGAASGLAFELEGKSGQIEVHRVDERTIALVGPPGIDAAELGDPDLEDDGIEIDVPSGQLAVIYIWIESTKSLGDAGAIIDIGAGMHQLFRREVADHVVMYVRKG